MTASKVLRLKSMLQQVAADQGLGLGALAEVATASMLEGLENDAESVRARSGLQKLVTGKVEAVSPEEASGLEAIVMARFRPVAFIRKGAYDALTEPWSGLNDDAVRARIQPLLGSIGRIELPTNPRIPYGGTGFVVGQDLVMTNRHVAKVFTDGVGVRMLRFTPGDAGIDFNREVETDPTDQSGLLEVRSVEMIHPYWDMALLRVEGLRGAREPLRLSVRTPEDLEGADIVVVGYPARDDRNDLALQDRIFHRSYHVKRFQPGKIRKRAAVRSFESTVSSLVHDSSTLGGNSGSAVLDIATGEVVGLHFAGEYLKANYAVPTYELASDARVVALGINFAGSVPQSGIYDAAWRQIEGQEMRRPAAGPAAPLPLAPPAVDRGAVIWTIPIQVAISVGQPTLVASGATPAAGAFPAVMPTEAPRLQAPVIYDDLESRAGYDACFLELDDGAEVPLPALTAAGKRIVARLDDDSFELKYHHFSVVMHKKRRLALFTASNIDWRRESRCVDGRKPTRRQLTGLEEWAQEQWVTDPRIPESCQLPDVFYAKDGGAFDKGHVVRRSDVAWGDSFEDMQKANGDTYHITNCSPQIAALNRSTSGENNWESLEDLVRRETKTEKACAFAGPVLDEGDRRFDGRGERGPVSIQIPWRFWKIVVTKGKSGPKAFGFVLEQDLRSVPLREELIVPVGWTPYIKSIDEIEQLLRGWVKLDDLKSFDQTGTEEGVRIGDKL
ncbi:DNA/RNA non-specific endonuclease [Sorangium sp. So ce385]|uniref:DNA/RNA non-specific endonuclease n=1 Tax=Sorangium sp. So ce385 TaxID=3133308 RepID=UPI003F5C956E